MTRSAQDIIEIGRDLIAAKKSLRHGRFLAWIDAEFEMTDRSARSFMRIADLYGAKSEMISDLPPTVLYALDALMMEVHRSQAHALAIRAHAEMRLAEEYDAAQERGEVASRGGEHSGREHSQVAPSAADLRLARKDIHEARRLRDAEVAEPGIVQRTIDEMVESGDDPLARLACRGRLSLPSNPIWTASPVAGRAS